jgi:hypothetical protein
MPIDQGYVFTREQYRDLLSRRYFPERTGRETVLMREWIKAHADEYDYLQFSVRLGSPFPVQPEHLQGIQISAWHSYAKRIDLLAWRGEQPWLYEVKERVTHYALGQLETYRYLFLKERPGVPDPFLGVIGRTSDPDTIEALQAAGVTVYLYELV